MRSFVRRAAQFHLTHTTRRRPERMEHLMSKSFLTATALVALLGFGATAAMAQQTAPTLNAPAVEKAAPVQSGKSATGTVQNKSAVKTTDSKAKRDSAAASCKTIKDK